MLLPGGAEVGAQVVVVVKLAAVVAADATSRSGGDGGGMELACAQIVQGSQVRSGSIKVL